MTTQPAKRSFFSGEIRIKRIMWLLFAIVLTLLAALWLIGFFLLRNPAVGSPGNAPSEPIAIETKALRGHVQALTQTPGYRHSSNTKALDHAAAYIHKQWLAMGLKPSYQPFKVGKVEYKNVLASVGPHKGPRIVVGAHYDVCGDQDGADDNASGVAGLLELSRLLHAKAKQLKTRIDLVAYTLEEPPYFATEHMGSAVHAKSLKSQGVEVKFMLSLEMIGYFSDQPNSQQFPFLALRFLYPTTGNFIAVVGNLSGPDRQNVRKLKSLMQVASPLPVYSINAPSMLPGIDFSDHRNYWAQGYSAAMVTDTSFFRNKNYHKKTDTIDTLDFDKMADVVRGVYWALLHF